MRARVVGGRAAAAGGSSGCARGGLITEDEDTLLDTDAVLFVPVLIAGLSVALRECG